MRSASALLIWLLDWDLSEDMIGILCGLVVVVCDLWLSGCWLSSDE
jgi:hypothetical protein